MLVRFAPCEREECGGSYLRDLSGGIACALCGHAPGEARRRAEVEELAIALGLNAEGGRQRLREPAHRGVLL